MAALLAEYGASTRDLPKIAGCYAGGSLVICGDSACVWADLEAFGCRSTPGAARCKGRLGLHGRQQAWRDVPRRDRALVLERFRRHRPLERSGGATNTPSEFPQPRHTHSCAGGAMWLWPWPAHGTSGLGAVFVGLGLGYSQIVLCGMPLDDGPHNGEPPWRRTKFTVEVRTETDGGYQPYPWQKEFHAAGADHPERMLMAANRVGKTISAACEVSFHLTGEYPEWWDRQAVRASRRWSGPARRPTKRRRTSCRPNCSAARRDARHRLGAAAPHARAADHAPGRRQERRRQLSGRTAPAAVSTCVLKTYEQGWQKWQGTAPHVVWMDEEPDDYKIFSESQTRILTSKGIVLVTFTPLLGVTDLVQHFSDSRRPASTSRARPGTTRRTVR
jgi:phage terminase large subunit-like protein